MIYTIFGRREQGKTTLARYMASRKPRRLIFDPRGMIGDDALRVAQRAHLDTACAELETYPAEPDAPTEVVYTPAGDSREDFAHFAGQVRHWIEACPDMPLAVLVDEVTLARPERSRDFMWALRCCRRDTVDFFITAHRPKDIDTDIRALADHWCIFAVRQEHDLDVIAERCSAAVVAQVQTLEPRHFIHWDDAHATAQRFGDPSTWRVELQPVRAVGSMFPSESGVDHMTGGIPVTSQIDTRKLF
jgi:hypothetical protein